MWRPRIIKTLAGLGLLAAQPVLAATGGSVCVNLLCVGATISGSDTIYTLNTTASFSSLGWMAIGFGQGMIGSPMVILWPNSDGSITLSQRQATGHFEPQVVSSPSSVATLRTDLSSLTGPGVTLSFSMPSTGETSQSMIYGLSGTKPGSSDVGATLTQHNAHGVFQLDLTQTVPDIAAASASGTATGSPSSTALAVPTQTGSSSSSNPFSSIPYSSSEKKFIAHAVLSGLGFCFFLPIGVLQARYLRIWWPMWFKTHWVVQAGLAGPFIVTGFALAVSAVAEQGGKHFADKHMIIGLVLFLLYLFQASYGYIIHLVKSPNRTKRPIQNYGHAIIGLGLIALSLYQVWLGFSEWANLTGRGEPKRGVKVFWIIWIVLLAVAYVLGLSLLPRQYKGERKAVMDRQKSQGMNSSDDVHPMTERHA